MEIKGDPFKGFLQALAGINMKLKLEEKILEHDFKVGDNVMRKAGIEIWTICDILENGEQLECQSTFDGRVRTFFWKGLKLAPQKPAGKFKVGDIVVQTGTCEVYTVGELLDDWCVEMMPNEHGIARRFHESDLELAQQIEVDHTNWGKSRISAINAAKGYMADSVTPKFDPDNVRAHLEVCGELNVTYERKNADYGDSFAQSLDKHGLIAAIVRMDDKMNRVINLNKADEQLVNDESVRDTLMDLANYAIMSVMWLDNKSGEECDGGSNYDIYADNLKLSGADYDGDMINS